MKDFTLTLERDQPLALGDEVSHRVGGSFAGATRRVHAVGRSVGWGSRSLPFPKTNTATIWTLGSRVQNIWSNFKGFPVLLQK